MLSSSEVIKKLKNYYVLKLNLDLYSYFIVLSLNFDQRYILF